MVCNAVIMLSCRDVETSGLLDAILGSLDPLSPLFGLQTTLPDKGVLTLKKNCGHLRRRNLVPTRSPNEFLDMDSGACTLQGGVGGRLLLLLNLWVILTIINHAQNGHLHHHIW